MERKVVLSGISVQSYQNQVMLLGFIREPESETRCLNEIVQGHAKSKLKPSGRIPDLLRFQFLIRGIYNT